MNSDGFCKSFNLYRNRHPIIPRRKNGDHSAVVGRKVFYYEARIQIGASSATDAADRTAIQETLNWFRENI